MPVQFPGVAGCRDARRILSDALSEGRLPRTILLSGPEGSGKRALALGCAQELLHDGSGRALRGEHPDVVIFDRGGDAVTVDEARALREAAFLSPTEADTRVFLLCHAQNLRVEAQNALLKLLEEPPVYLFLLCENDGAILETVRSRCLKLSTQPPDAAEAQAILRARCPDAPAQTLTRLLSDAGGYPETAAALWARRNTEEGRRAAQLAETLIDRALAGDELGLWRAILAQDKLSRDDCALLLAVLSEQLLHRMETDGASAELLRLSELAARMRALVPKNVHSSHILGLFSQYFVQ